eukprot:CAMPEP_0177663582 /NCGR_PEP_ID=MMETSP0447-20121125/19998_1 /TAXON_ID=0 /ORGANISM="Stygamoeba regulata, Strain BSH-02190019" /LENGTH=138 /DNA_ID=CAMNT_0019169419 /DNA_START=269 /DNA_END=685 /DNA_ORIENTATION=-
MYLSLHHMTPDLATSILKDAVKNGDGYAAFELQRRSIPFILALALFVPFYVMLLTPFALPLTPARLLWTYVFPVVPFFTAFDGVVSCLRTYSRDEFMALTRVADPDGAFEWHYQSVPIALAGFVAMEAYWGVPKQKKE